ncbi:hypothetical protein G3485_03415 [Shewanella baltica]|uniref:hypothetical protein n=1 Tax=Shewanella baltica TaxID=62322 RepID=UPI00217D2555|nr:hypothetical protein [Shewanella baltica]MCS6125741.1 hypothetical protein [Shewanella baltica]MCS6138145.1 hypothetical protein [Shewanella baltica]MCS6144014.1 hypothetical protein [Shewanella baltica]MCS6168531.1 hypothetical protein [Shewanella baltica]MCS6185733.1 hypothetical protein [Shewanella baltica]
MKWILAITVLLAPLSASALNANLDRLTLMSEITLAGKPAVVFYLGSDVEENYCSISATKDYVLNANGQLLNIKRDQPEFDVSCNWDGEYYVLSSNHITRAEVVFIKSTKNTPMAIRLNAMLTTTKGELATFNSPNIDVVAK